MFDRMRAAFQKYLFWEGLVLGVIVCQVFYSRTVVRRMDEGYEASVKMLQAETTESHTLSMELMRVLKKTEQERDGLRRSYLLECLSESLWETPSTDVGDTIIGGIKKLGGTIDAIEFVKLLGKAPEDARVRVVV